ncbi:MAG: hypothetical protein SGI92_09630 [Bryobacteraceae bacterium]|nr:hypothetical protein [Bryobacteraceae bacterium]
MLVLLSQVSWAADEGKTRSWRLTEINAKIAELERQLEYWKEKKRVLVDIPDAPREALKENSKPVHRGPRNGKYHYSDSGKKVYERK